jgi:hypothetical protein
MRSLLYLLSCTCTVSAAVLQHPFLSTSLPVHANQQPDSSSPVDYPYRELPWGEVNILHTTDTYVHRALASETELIRPPQSRMAARTSEARGLVQWGLGRSVDSPE